MQYRLRPLVAILALAPATVFAAGFQLAETSVTGLGRAYAGEAAANDSIAVLSRNSAGIAGIDKSQFVVSGIYVIPQVDIEGTETAHYNGLYNQAASAANNALGSQLAMLPTSYDGSTKDLATSELLPTLYFATPIRDGLVFGFGTLAEFGLSTDYNGNTLEYGDKTELTAITFKPSLAWQLTPEVAVGAGLRFVYGEATLSTATPAYFDDVNTAVTNYNAVAAAAGGALPTLLAVPGFQPILHVTGDDWGYGYELGTVWTPSRDWRLAVSYRSSVDLTFEGSAKSVLSAVANGPGSVDLTLPASLELAMRWQALPQLALYAGGQRTGWHSFDKLVVDMDSGVSFTAKEENWRDVWRYAIGADWQVAKSVILRAGYANDQSPVPEANRTLSIPDVDRQWFSVGAGWQYSSAWTLDFGLAFLKGEKGNINEEFAINYNGNQVAVSSFNGSLSRADVVIAGLSASYQF